MSITTRRRRAQTLIFCEKCMEMEHVFVSCWLRHNNFAHVSRVSLQAFSNTQFNWNNWPEIFLSRTISELLFEEAQNESNAFRRTNRSLLAKNKEIEEANKQACYCPYTSFRSDNATAWPMTTDFIPDDKGITTCSRGRGSSSTYFAVKMRNKRNTHIEQMPREFCCSPSFCHSIRFHSIKFVK